MVSNCLSLVKANYNSNFIQFHLFFLSSTNFIFCTTTTEINEWFTELNHDSERKIHYISNDYLICDLRNILLKDYSKYFAKTKNVNNKIFTINES